VKLILIPVSLGGVIMFIYGLLETMRSKIIIAANSISSLSILGTKTLDFREIKGFRINNNDIHIISNNKGRKSIKLTIYN